MAAPAMDLDVPMQDVRFRLIPKAVRIVYIQPENVKALHYQITHALFFAPQKNGFVSATASDEEFSLILDVERYERAFANDDPSDDGLNSNKDLLVLDQQQYRVYQIFEGSSGIDHIGVVAKISSMFAMRDVTIIYVNSFNNNFVLAAEEETEKVLQILTDLNFERVTEDSDSEGGE